jgi:hypothetical protein
MTKEKNKKENHGLSGAGTTVKTRTRIRKLKSVTDK